MIYAARYSLRCQMCPYESTSQPARDHQTLSIRGFHFLRLLQLTSICIHFSQFGLDEKSVTEVFTHLSSPDREMQRSSFVKQPCQKCFRSRPFRTCLSTTQ